MDSRERYLDYMEKQEPKYVRFGCVCGRNEWYVRRRKNGWWSRCVCGKRLHLRGSMFSLLSYKRIK